MKKQKDVGEELDYDVMSLDFPRSKSKQLDKMFINLSDATLYGKFSHTVFKGKGNRGVVGGTGERILLTESTPAIMAKNRFGMPSEIEVYSHNKGYTSI